MELVHGGPDEVVRAWDEICSDPDAGIPRQARLPHLAMPARRDVRSGDVRLRRLQAALAAAADRGPVDFPELLLTPGVGARTVEALALVAEVVYGAPSRFSDPARFSLAHGGKDGHPFPVSLKVYDRTIAVLRRAVAAARLGRDDRLAALRRLDRQARALEGRVGGPSLATLLEAERAASPRHGGRTVVGDERDQLPFGSSSRASRARGGDSSTRESDS